MRGFRVYTHILVLLHVGFRYVGKHRRVLLQDVLKYKANIDRARNETLSELVAQAQELNMGYK